MRVNTRTGMARLGLVAAATVALATNALPAQAAEAPTLNAWLSPVTMAGEGSPGKVVPLYIAEQNAANPTISFDVADLAGVASLVLPDECAKPVGTVTVFTCPLPTLNTSQLALPLIFEAAKGASTGDSGRITFTTRADNVEAATSMQTVKIVDGTDLVVVGGDGDGGHVKPGRSFEPAPLVFYNAGNAASAGFNVTVHFDSGLVPDQYENCAYSAVGHGTLMSCTFDGPDGTLEPGKGVELGGLNVTVTGDAAGAKGIDYYVAPGDAVVPPSLAMHQGTGGKKLTLTTTTVSTIASDIDKSDNFATFSVEVDNPIDLAALPATVTGTVGQTVKAKIGIRNNGPGSIDATRRGGATSVPYVFVVPEGVEVTAAPSRCASIIENSDGTQRARQGAAGGTYYRCWANTWFGAGETYTAEFSLKITSLTLAPGSVSLNDKYVSPPVMQDANPANNTAAVTVAAPSSGGTGGGGSLPITGAKAGLLGGAGAGLLGLGALAFVLARRRRVILVSGPDGTGTDG